MRVLGPRPPGGSRSLLVTRLLAGASQWARVHCFLSGLGHSERCARAGPVVAYPLAVTLRTLGMSAGWSPRRSLVSELVKACVTVLRAVVLSHHPSLVQFKTLSKTGASLPSAPIRHFFARDGFPLGTDTARRGRRGVVYGLLVSAFCGGARRSWTRVHLVDHRGCPREHDVLRGGILWYPLLG